LTIAPSATHSRSVALHLDHTTQAHLDRLVANLHSEKLIEELVPKDEPPAES
jgi:hypothetical protein